MRTQHLILGIIGTSILFSGCSSMRVATDYDRDATFNQYKTYKIEQTEITDRNAVYVFNELNRARIERAINQNLVHYGLEAGDESDLIVSYSMNADVRKNYSTSATHTDMGSPWRGRYSGGPGFGSSQSTTQEYQTVEGQLMVSIADAKSGKLLWYGAVISPLDGNGKKAEKTISTAVGKIFESFPMEKSLMRSMTGEEIVSIE